MNIPTPLRIVLLRISPPCNEITLLASKGMDTRLSIRERWRLHFHFLICASCKRFNIQLHTLHDVVHHAFNASGDAASQALISSASHATLPKEARQRIEQAISDAL